MYLNFSWFKAKRSAMQLSPFSSLFFLTLRRFLSFSVIQISPHSGHLHLLLWNTSLNWSWGWEEHPAGTEKRSGGSETELVVPLFLAGWRVTVHLTASPSFSWRHEISSPLPHFCNCWHPFESTESHSFCVWTEVFFSILALKHRNSKNLSILWPPCYIYVYIYLFILKHTLIPWQIQCFSREKGIIFALWGSYKELNNLYSNRFSWKEPL